MDGAFDTAFRSNANFQSLLSMLQAELPNSLLPQMVNTFEATMGGFIFLGAAGEGSFDNHWNNITIDSQYLPVSPSGSAAATTQDLQTVEEILSHELGHLLYDHMDFLSAPNETTAGAQGNRSEGTALTVEFIATQQLGLPMYSGSGIQAVLTKVLQTDGDALSTDPNSQFWADSVNAAAAWAAGSSIKPSSAPSLSSTQMYEYSWALNKSAVVFGNVNWFNVQPDDIRITSNPDGTSTIGGAALRLLDSSDTQTFSATVSSSGQTISGRTMAFSGSTEVGSASEALQSNGTESITMSGRGVEAGGEDAAVSVSGDGDVVHGTGNVGTTSNWGGYVNQAGQYGGMLEEAITAPAPGLCTGLLPMPPRWISPASGLMIM